MKNSLSQTIPLNTIVVKSCKVDLSRYFHPPNQELSKKFLLFYQILNLNYTSFSKMISVDRTTMNRYRRGIWIPSQNMKIKISQMLSKEIGKIIYPEMIWGDMEIKLEVEENER